MEKKMTKKEVFAELKVLAQNANRTDLMDAIDHEIELLDRKNATRTKTESKNQKANKELKEKILLAMKEDTSYRALEIFELVPDFKEKGFTNNKANALITQLKNEGLVIRTEEKGVAYFTKAQSKEKGMKIPFFIKKLLTKLKKYSIIIIQRKGR